jgi:hypothetical protein|nr:MAG TPA: hypothetical protein [Caudoviricetes sp.]
MKSKCYAMYRGDTFIDLGTIPELAAKYHKTIDMMRWLSYPTAHRRNKNGKRLLLYKIGDDDDD